MIVIKIGGTSLNSEIKRNKAIKAISSYAKDDKVIVIVSAIGRFPESYATDTLFRLIDSHISEEETARLVSCGEIISSVILSNRLKKAGRNAHSISPFDIDLTYYEDLDLNIEKFSKYFAKYDILIVPGFIAIRDNKIKLLPRGGSTITASFFAATFKATKLIIISDVLGIYNNDPKKYKDAKILPSITYQELISLTENNPRFFPPMAIEYLKNNQIPVLFRSLDNIKGTLIN